MPRSPIEMMVDRACGLPDGWDKDQKPKPSVLLKCPSCKRTRRAAVDKTDPPGTAIVQVQCPECNRGDFDEVLYFDANGKQLLIV